MVVSVVSLIAIGRVEWPAYPSSNQLHALTTVGQFACLALRCRLVVRRRGRRTLARLVSVLFLTGFVVTTSVCRWAPPVYLFRISVDQQFRYRVPDPADRRSQRCTT